MSASILEISVGARFHVGFDFGNLCWPPTRRQPHVDSHCGIRHAHYLAIHVLGSRVERNVIAKRFAHPYHPVCSGEYPQDDADIRLLA
jgi:hypothetical protein